MPTVKKEEVVDSWSILIGNGKGNAGNIFDNTEKSISQTNVPNVQMEKRGLSPGIIRGLFGAKRDFLIVTETKNPSIKPYQMLINARDYGNNLDVSWYLTYRLSLSQKLVALLSLIPILNLVVAPFSLTSMFKEKRGSLGLDLFDEQDLRAYVTNVHHCVLGAVDKLVLSLNQDPSKIDRKTRGFLGIS